MNARRVQGSPNIREIFLSDHRRLDALFGQIIAAFEANDREDIGKLWAEFETGLTTHMEAEERTLIPALARVDPTEANGILTEHGRIRARLAELGPSVDLHVVRLDVARAFIDEIKAHAEREDRALYAWGDEHLAEPDRAKLLADLRDAARNVVRKVLGSGKSTPG